METLETDDFEAASSNWFQASFRDQGEKKGPYFLVLFTLAYERNHCRINESPALTRGIEQQARW